ncbi:MAG: hypothetical protein ACRD0V_09135, partial [Acidimicrobiales bacterium]
AAGPRVTLADKALAHLAERHAAGVDIEQIGAAELDRAVGASPGYSKKRIRAWREQVVTHADADAV